MKQKNNLLVRLLALFCVCSLLLVGCGKGKETAEKADDTPKETAVDDDGRELVGNVYKEGLPIVKEKETFSTYVSTNHYLKTPAKDQEMWKVLEERTNVSLDIQEIPATNYGEKVNLLISSDDLPDAFMLSIGEITSKYYNTQQFLPLDDYISEWAPNYAKALQDPIVYANVVAPDGKVYSTPYGEMAPWLICTENMFINSQWLETLGLDMPTNLDEYYDVLLAFKEDDPNGNGLADEIPLVARMLPGANNLIPFFGNFGLPMNQQYALIEDKAFVFAPLEERFREGLEYFNKLYADGLLDPESFTQDLAEMQAKGSGEHQLIGALIAFWADDYTGGEEALHYDTIPPFPVDGGEPIWLNTTPAPSTGGLSVTKEAKNPETILRWADYIIETPYRVYEVENGPEEMGVFTTTEDGKAHLNSEDAPAGMTFEEWTRTSTIRGMVPFYLSPDDVLEGRTVDLAPQRKLDYIESYVPYMAEEPITHGHINYFEDDAVRQEATTLWTDIDSLVRNYMAESIIDGVTDENWDSFQETLQKAKVERYVEIYQASLDHYYETVA